MRADTIFALASARGRSGVAVVRISGDRAHQAVRALCGELPAERRASLRTLRWNDDVLDEAIVTIFGDGRSFTGEAVAELHLHGSIAVVSAVLGALGRMEGLRPAQAGEFTWRAMENGRLDFTQVEGLADLLLAETNAQRRQAQRVLSGSIGRTADGWRVSLIQALALLESTIDFVDEDVPAEVTEEVTQVISAVRVSMGSELRGVRAAERIRDGFEVAIVGRPNVGKSTLLNRLAGRDAALTSEIAGTTRDVIEVRMDIGGMAVTLLDTAGLRDSDDAIEELGIARARQRAETADLRVFLVEEGENPDSDLWRPGDIAALSKGDLYPEAAHGVSGLTGGGIDNLVSRIEAQLVEQVASVGTLTRVRHENAVRMAVEALVRAEAGLLNGDGYEIVSEELRVAARSLEVLVGRLDVEDILDQVFSSFCIGK
ncbi:tRNA uridine-5-carboxymethylaminomethyl(34) synthesis GTPase MnmE [Rhodobaculum claviforme]|uniref:tRNA modification GTPase MnmE n=1 Tax=Rhodobaculum claviforme TaxID=1549854 RepID=A0A934TK15_9RHOB|nr:tRNA uridine-5-carboxymethylaminomethyl(34) synthesis GTPase MnmE [Rhodobaculum claviforme]MBK5927038.1 tRNA uridine-5-carboxymethylaminomethyl(34) synthesis GTPase MnmE [Rhodobaculum claviforme]